MTRQTATPLVDAGLDGSTRRLQELVRMVETGDLDLGPEYQRGDVWTEDQRIALVRSWLTGIPTGTVILNDRGTPAWKKRNRTSPLETGAPLYVVIDGKQRITTTMMWLNDEFGVPASWFPTDQVEDTFETSDGPYVRNDQLTTVGQRMLRSRALIQAATAGAADAQEEAAIYLLVNGGGTVQSEDDMANAAAVANNLG